LRKTGNGIVTDPKDKEQQVSLEGRRE
jgi:hypothetical protein